MHEGERDEVARDDAAAGAADGAAEQAVGPDRFTERFMAAWRADDVGVLASLIHPEAQLETVAGPSSGRQDAVTLLRGLKNGIYSVQVDRVEELSQIEGIVYARARRPTPPRGFVDGALRWQIELRDGMLWRSQII